MFPLHLLVILVAYLLTVLSAHGCVNTESNGGEQENSPGFFCFFFTQVVMHFPRNRLNFANSVTTAFSQLKVFGSTAPDGAAAISGSKRGLPQMACVLP